MILLSKSRPRKLREKAVREGHINPNALRSPYTKSSDAFKFISEKRGKNKKDLIYKDKHKNRQSYF